MHQVLSSHKEKQDCVRLSMGGQPWPELELAGHWELAGEGRGRGRGERRGGGGMGRGRAAGGAPGLDPGSCFPCCWVLFVRAVREKEKKRKKGNNMIFF
jgi:hypothetical protein